MTSDQNNPPISWKKNLFCAWLGQILCMAGNSAIIPFIPLFIRDKYHLTDEKSLGVYVAFFSFFGLCSFCFSTPMWGVLADKYGRKLMLLRSYYACGIFLPLLYFAPDLTWLIVFRFISSIFSGTLTAAQTLIVSTTPKEHHGFALGTLSTAVWSGNMIGFLIGSFSVNYFGYMWGFLSCGAVYLIAGVITHIFVEEHFVRPPKSEKKGGFLDSFRGLSIAVIMVLILFVWMGMARRVDEPYISMLVTLVVPSGKEIFYTGMISLVSALGGLVSGIIMGKLCDRLSPGVVAMPAILIAALTMFLQACAGNVWLLGTERFIHFTAAAGLEPAFQSILARIVPDERRGTIFGLASSMRMVGILIASLLGGGLICLFGSCRSIFAGAGVLFLLLVPLFIYSMRMVRKEDLSTRIP